MGQAYPHVISLTNQLVALGNSILIPTSTLWPTLSSHFGSAYDYYDVGDLGSGEVDESTSRCVQNLSSQGSAELDCFRCVIIFFNVYF